MFRRYSFPLATPPESQREDWYVVSDHIAEFWCCISNIGFLVVCYYHGFTLETYPILTAALCSMVSHAVPIYPLLLLDKAAMYFTGYAYRHLWRELWFLIPLLFMCNQIDMVLARRFGWTWPHVVWHLVAAFISHIVLQELKEKLS